MGIHSHPSYRFGVSVAALYAAAGAATVGGEALAGETNAMGIDFTYHTDVTKQCYISDLTTPANDYNGTPYGKLTYTSPSVKLTRQSDGVWRYGNHNLCLQSQDFSTTWTNTGSSEATNTQVAPDGTTTADTVTASSGTSAHHLPQVGITPAHNGPYTFSIYAKKGTHPYILLNIQTTVVQHFITAIFNLDSPGSAATQTGVGSSSGTIISTSVTSMGSGWYRFSITGSLTVTTSIALLVGLAGAATGNTLGTQGGNSWTAAGTETAHLWGAELKRYPVQESTPGTITGYIATTTSAVYDFPYEWDAALASHGILTEEARINIALRSRESETAGTFVGNNITFSGGTNVTTAPDGTTTADKAICNGGNGQHYIYQGITATAATYTFSVFLKAAELTFAQVYFAGAGDNGVTVDLSNGTLGVTTGTSTNAIQDAGNGWYRVSVTRTAAVSEFVVIGLANSNTGIRATINADGSGIYIWGWQFELGAFATSPIHTVAGTVTRAVDNISLAVSGIPFSTTVGTMVLECQTLTNSGNPVGLSLGASKMYFQDQGASFPQFIVGGVADIDCGSIAIDTTTKWAGAWQVNDYAGVIGGGTVGVDPSGAVPTSITTMYFGSLAGSTVGSWRIRKVTYLARRATDVELQTRTT